MLSILIDAIEVYIIALSKTDTGKILQIQKQEIINNQSNDQKSGEQSSLAVNHYKFG